MANTGVAFQPYSVLRGPQGISVLAGLIKDGALPPDATVDDLVAFFAERVPSGSDGTDGAPGRSAYEVAVADGFSGTITEWLTSLHGAPGTDAAPAANAAALSYTDTLSIGATNVQDAITALAIQLGA